MKAKKVLETIDDGTIALDFQGRQLHVGDVVILATESQSHGNLTDGYITGIQTIQHKGSKYNHYKQAWVDTTHPEIKIQVTQPPYWFPAMRRGQEPWQTYFGEELPWQAAWLKGPERMLLQPILRNIYISRQETLWRDLVDKALHRGQADQ